jgi:Recombinase
VLQTRTYYFDKNPLAPYWPVPPSVRPGPPEAVLLMMARWRSEQKKSLWKIADELNQLGPRTGRGSRWYPSTVSLQLKALAKRLRTEASTPATKTVDSIGLDEMTLDDFAALLEKKRLGRPVAR